MITWRRVTLLRWVSVFGLALALPGIIEAQGTLEDYRRAATISQRFDGLTVGVVEGGVNWIGSSNRFWYRVSVRDGHQFMQVDADAWSKQPAFDHERLARALSAAAGGQYTGVTLPFTTFNYVSDGQAIEADANRSRWRCTLTDYTCTRIGEAQAGPGFGRGGGRGQGGQGRAGGRGGQPAEEESVVRSPDRLLEAFIQNYN
ncbi:MAG TPA: hypothetical protein VK864_10585, partial [Longimicrobiales bacterium]|nr:hypothetical protein [Longimicrobiales bacterium]